MSAQSKNPRHAVGQAEEEEEQLAEGTLISHLIELRSRLVKATLAVGLVFLALVPFAQEIYTTVAEPMMESLADDTTMIVTGIASPFLVPFKTTLFAAIFIAMPVVLFQAWQFVAPGLYRKEKRFALPLVLSSIVLFYCGIAFAYFVVFPLIFQFFALATPEGVTQAPDINAYLDFILTIFLAFGLAFEVPIATFMLIWTRLTSIAALSKARPYVFLSAFVIGMFLTPPDFISQTLLAVPMYLLYESGLVLSRFLLADRFKQEQAEREAEEEAP
jgi:sec-independent protein translocase protein TatC